MSDRTSSSQSGMLTRIQEMFAGVPERVDLFRGIAIAIWGVVFMISILVSRITMREQRGLILLGFLIGISFLIILNRWPGLGFCLIIVVALMLPFSLSTGSATGVNAAALILIALLGLWILGMITRRDGFRLIKNRAVYAALIFCVISLIAFGFGQFSWFPTASAPINAQIGGLMIFLLTAGAFLIVAHQVRSERVLRAMTWVFLVLAALYVLIRLVGFPNSVIYRIFVRQAAQGAMFFIFLISMSASQALLNTELSARWRVVIGGLMVATLTLNLVFSRYWLSGWIPPLVGLFVILLLIRPRWAILVAGLAVIYLLVGSNIIQEIFYGGDNAFSRMTRLEAWRILAEMVSVSPVLGLGMANYYWYTPLYSILGYSVSFNSHNNYVDIVAQAGLLGLGIYLWWLLEIFLTGWRLLKRLRSGFLRAYTYGVIGGLAGAVFAGMLGDWIVPFVYNIGLEGFRASVIGWMFMGGLVAIENMQQTGTEIEQG